MNDHHVFRIKEFLLNKFYFAYAYDSWQFEQDLIFPLPNPLHAKD